MHVVFLTHYYPPEVGAPQARIAALAHRLAGRGIDVTVHTGFPHYPSGTIRPPYRNRPLTVERDGPVRVVRSAVYPTANRGFARRLANHASLAASALATAHATGRTDVVVTETPPLFTAAGGVLYAARKRAALVLNVSDLWPDSAVDLGMLVDRRAIALAKWLERFCYRRAAAITAPTEAMVATLAAMGEAAGKVVRVPPAVDLERFDPAPAPGGVPLRVLYAGTLGMAQGVGVLVEAARLENGAVEVSIAGEGPDGGSLAAQIAASGLQSVRLLGRVDPSAIPALYADSHVVVVPLRDRPIFAGALPTKLFEAMAAARPVVVCARGEAAALVETAGAGLVVPPEDPAALAGALRQLAGDPAAAAEMGARGRSAAAAYDRERAVDTWARLLGDVSGPG